MADATRIQIPAELERRMDEAIARYPTGHRRSAAMPLLHLWQEHFGFIGDEAVFWIADKLGLQPINILEVVTFYPMFRQHPAGKTHIRICRTLSCAMAGGLELMENVCARLESSARVMVKKCIIRSRSARTELTALNSLSVWPAATPRQCVWLAKNCARR